MKTIPVILMACPATTTEVPAWAKEKEPIKITYFIGIGPSFPTADLNDRWDQGLHISARFDFAASPILSVWAGFDYHRFPFSPPGEASGFKSINFSGDLKINLANPDIGLNPYFFGGAGVATIKKTDFFLYRSDTAVHVNLGAYPTKTYPLMEYGGGMSFKNVFIHVRYVSVFSDNYSTGFVPVTMGVKF